MIFKLSKHQVFNKVYMIINKSKKVIMNAKIKYSPYQKIVFMVNKKKAIIFKNNIKLILKLL